MSARHPRAVLVGVATGIFTAVGIGADAARAVAEALVESDMRGVPSHGLLLVPMYVDRLRHGSVTRHETAEVLRAGPPAALLDARHALGVLTADQAMAFAVEYARGTGVGVVAVAHAFHFGGAFRYARAAARAGCIGVAAANTRPLMPAPGGARAVVGNNPLAIAVPVAGREPMVLDMALSEAALGKIRLAQAAGREIPPTWATDAAGRPTTDPAAALGGLLLPAAGPKGYGLALMLDVLTGVLSGGAFGSHVQGLYRDPAVPNDCAHFFLALDPAAFCGNEPFAAAVTELAASVLDSPTVDGVERVLLPGDREADAAAAAELDGVPVDDAVLAALLELADQLTVTVATELRR